MGLIEFISTPFYLLVIIGGAFVVRPFLTDQTTRKYFIPGLLVKLVGAISLGLIYQYYYVGGDTLNYYYYGSAEIWKAFLDFPILAFKLIFLAGTEYESSTFQYASRIISYGDLPSYAVVRLAGLFGIMTLNSYYATSLLFATFSFTGTWMMFQSFYKLVPAQHFKIALAVLFVPSVFFWGSGLLKDTITFGAIGWFIYSFLELFVHKRKNTLLIFSLLLSAYALYVVKIYILLSLAPAMIIFLFLNNLASIKNMALRIFIGPVIVAVAIFSSYQAVLQVGDSNAKYSIDNFIKTAQVSSEWLYWVSRQEGGSGYTLGDNDYSPAGVAQKFLPAVWVSLFRPYPWEVNSVVMLMSSLESTLMLLITLWLAFKVGFYNCLRIMIKSPMILTLLIFSISFAFAIGFSTYNFGSLVRYKIPLIPFFLFALILIWERAEQKTTKSIGATI